MITLVIITIGIILLTSIYFLREWIKAILKTILLIVRMAIIIPSITGALFYLEKLEERFIKNTPKQNIDILKDQKLEIPLEKEDGSNNDTINLKRNILPNVYHG